MKEALARDQIAQDIQENQDNEEDFEEQDSILTYQRLVYVPVSCQKKLVNKFHGAQPHNHQGSAKTLEQISQTYYFPHMQKFVKNVLQKCNTCRKAKHKKHQLYGLIKSLKTPMSAWTSVALNFIVKLPKSKEPITKVVYNLILVITDRLTKYGYFIPYKEASSVENLAYTFYKYVVGNHGLPEEIISDRDKLFTSKFWKSLMDLIGTKYNFLTSYHLQTNGQTEQLNQTLEQYL